MLVNESFVRSHLAGLIPIGTTLRTLAEPGFPETTYEIIGVVGDTKYADLREENCWCPGAGEASAPIAYVPIAQNPVRTRGLPSSSARAVPRRESLAPLRSGSGASIPGSRFRSWS
jgi:hypothetical protein